MDLRDRFRGCLLGLAVGDAVGTTVEFRPRGSFRPLADMIGGGPFQLRPGQWTDDTSMALCLATSLVECNGFDALDQMERYCKWADSGYLSSTGACFDIGNTVASALRRFRQTGNPFAGSSDPYSAGNGCIMRLAPTQCSSSRIWKQQSGLQRRVPELLAVQQSALMRAVCLHGSSAGHSPADLKMKLSWKIARPSWDRRRLWPLLAAPTEKSL